MRGAFLCLDAVAFCKVFIGWRWGVVAVEAAGGSAWFGWKGAYAVGLALGVKYVTQFTAFRFGCFQEPLYSYMCCQGDLVKEM